MFDLAARPRRIAAEAGLVAAGLLGGLLAGALGARSTELGVLAAGAIVLAGIAARRPVGLAVVALVGVYASQRVGGVGGANGISYSDLLLAGASLFAVPALLVDPDRARLRTALLGVAAYQLSLLPTVVLHPSQRASLEWVHRLVLVGGALVVGAWIAREGVTRLALRWLIAVTCLIALATVLDAARHGFAPGSPLQLNKNFVGALFGAVLVVLVGAARHAGLSQRTQLLAVTLTAAGLLASQSRGGMLAAAGGLLVAFALDLRAHGNRAKALAAIVAVAFTAFVTVSVRGELGRTRRANNDTSIAVRFNVERATRDIWHTSPLTGVGLKYFSTGQYGPFAAAANNDVDNELAESGLIGLAGFLALQAGAVASIGLRRRRRRGDALAAAAVGCVVGELLHGMVDIYWTAGTVTLPFLLLGIALGQRPQAQDGNSTESTLASSRAHS